MGGGSPASPSPVSEDKMREKKDYEAKRRARELQQAAGCTHHLELLLYSVQCRIRRGGQRARLLLLPLSLFQPLTTPWPVRMVGVFARCY